MTSMDGYVWFVIEASVVLMDLAEFQVGITTLTVGTSGSSTNCLQNGAQVLGILVYYTTASPLCAPAVTCWWLRLAFEGPSIAAPHEEFFAMLT